jgi:hypothetical protein
MVPRAVMPVVIGTAQELGQGDDLGGGRSVARPRRRE